MVLPIHYYIHMSQKEKYSRKVKRDPSFGSFFPKICTLGELFYRPGSLISNKIWKRIANPKIEAG